MALETSVSGNQQWTYCENRRVARIDADAHAMQIFGSHDLKQKKPGGLSAGGVHEAPHAKAVTVCVYDEDATFKGSRLSAQSIKQCRETGLLTARCIHKYVGLPAEHDGWGTLGLSQIETPVEPSQVGRLADRMLMRHGEVVVGSDDMERAEADPAVGPGRVLHKGRMGRLRQRLAFEPHSPPPSALIRTIEEDTPEVVQPFKGVIALPVTIGPFVVAGGVDDGHPRSIQTRYSVLIDAVLAATGPRLDVPDVDAESRPVPNLVDQPVEVVQVLVSVRLTAEGCEAEGTVRWSGHGQTGRSEGRAAGGDQSST